MSTAYNNLSDAIQIAAATGNNEALLELRDIVDSTHIVNDLSDMEYLELLGDIAGGLQ